MRDKIIQNEQHIPKYGSFMWHPELLSAVGVRGGVEMLNSHAVFVWEGWCELRFASKYLQSEYFYVNLLAALGNVIL